MSNNAEVEASVRSNLNSFVDIFYAAIFAFILLQVFTDVIDSKVLSFKDKVNGILLVMGVFYFLTWDWLHARLLTLRNPLQGYRRFFFDLMITFFSYGAALRAFRAKPTFLIYIVVILLVGIVWATRALSENKESEDKKELRIIEQMQFLVAIILIGTYVYVHVVLEVERVGIYETTIFLVAGWLFVFIYEWGLDRPDGILGGPGAPLMTRERIRRIKAFISAINVR